MVSTRVDAELLVPAAVREAVALVRSEAPGESADGCARLALATFNNPVAKEAAGAEGAIQAVVDAMARNSQDAKALEGACHALRNVAFHCPPNLALVRAQGAIAAVLNAMEQHPEHEALQAEALWALLVFCSNEDENAAVAKPSVGVVKKALERFTTNSHIQSRCRFLVALLS